ncbi:MAG: DUF2723 domain-containing protein [bacterium]|nr:DUF2723 domain-containing protein [bacterium]
MTQEVDKRNLVIGFSVWLFVLVIYWLTKAPTVSFWDCGEFIAASVSLGVPHPPGTPLYVLIGRVFSLLPLAADVGVRINLLSSISSAFTALFGYLVGVRLLRSWFGTDKSTVARFLMYAGSVSGSLFLAFGLTNWNNSVEAEVYGLSMMIFLMILWLSLVYIQNQYEGRRIQISILIFYLAFAGIAVHMTTFLIVPIIAILFILKKDAPASIWYMVAAFFVLELYLIFALSSRPGEIAFYVPTAILFALYLFYVFSFEEIPRVYTFGLVGFATAVAPLYLKAYDVLTKASLGPGAMEAASIIGKVGLGLLGLFGAYLLFKYRSDNGGTHSSPSLITAIFALTAIAAVGILYLPKGYVSFLIVTALATLLLAGLLWKHISWTMLIAVAGVAMVVLGVKEFFWGSLIAAVLVLAAGLMFRLPGWKPALAIIIVSVVGYSIHTYIPIRSAQHPAINENNPSQNLTATINYIERKQYGSMSMTERMFVRRSEWENQFGIHSRMGFWGFFSEQYGLNGTRFVIIFLLGIFGVWELIRRRPMEGLILLLLILIGSVGLILYMNFADGTRQQVNGLDYLEVRDRDYFFTPAFILFGLAMGLGSAILVQFVRESTARFSKVLHHALVVFSGLLFLLPSFALAGNYFVCDRSQNYMPYDYAWNILQSAEKDAVLFTNGDNDTFPVWCLQEAYGIRKDVKVINLSLANTKWYIKQVQDDMGVDLGWTEKEIDALRPFRIQDGTVFRIQDQVIDAAINENLGERPINFSITVGSSARKYLGKSADSMLMLSGMSWRVKPERDGMQIDFDESLDFYMNQERFKHRGVADSTVYKDPTTLRLTGNYANGILILARALEGAGRQEDAEKLARFGINAIPFRAESYNFLANLYSNQGRTEEIRTLMDTSPENNRNRMRYLLARGEIKDSNFNEAARLLEVILGEEPDNRQALDELVRLYYEKRRYIEMRTTLQRWVQLNPQDSQMAQLLEELDREILKASRGTQDTLQ